MQEVRPAQASRSRPTAALRPVAIGLDVRAGRADARIVEGHRTRPRSHRSRRSRGAGNRGERRARSVRRRQRSGADPSLIPGLAAEMRRVDMPTPVRPDTAEGQRQRRVDRVVLRIQTCRDALRIIGTLDLKDEERKPVARQLLDLGNAVFGPSLGRRADQGARGHAGGGLQRTAGRVGAGARAGRGQAARARRTRACRDVRSAHRRRQARQEGHRALRPPAREPAPAGPRTAQPPRVDRTSDCCRRPTIRDTAACCRLRARGKCSTT